MDGDGDKEYDNRTAIPHAWEGAVVYLSLMAAYNPQLLRPKHLAPGGPAEEPADSEDGCSTAGGGPAGGVTGLLLLGVLLWRVRTRC